MLIQLFFVYLHRKTNKTNNMTFEEFIKNHVKVALEGKHIEMTSEQYAFIDWLEKCKKKGLKPLDLKGRGRI